MIQEKLKPKKFNIHDGVLFGVLLARLLTKLCVNLFRVTKIFLRRLASETRNVRCGNVIITGLVIACHPTGTNTKEMFCLAQSLR